MLSPVIVAAPSLLLNIRHHAIAASSTVSQPRCSHQQGNQVWQGFRNRMVGGKRNLEGCKVVMVCCLSKGSDKVAAIVLDPRLGYVDEIIDDVGRERYG